MPDEFSRTWNDDVDSTSAEDLNDLEERQVSRVLANTGSTMLGSISETTSQTSTTNSLSVSTTDQLGALTVTVTTASRPVVVDFYCQRAYNGTSGDGAIAYIFQDGTAVQAAQVDSAAANSGAAMFIRTPPLSPASGSHTYIVGGGRLSAGTAHFTAAALSPMTLTVREV